MNKTAGFSFLAPAKINVTLKVFGRRSDGLHDIRSVMLPVSLYDVVTVDEAGSGICVTADDPSVPVGRSNSCHRAAELFMEWAGAPKGVHIRIRKAIPSEAGLGGGSSDAAAAFRGMMALSGRVPPRETLMRMSAEVGADVPFFDRLTPVEWRVPFFTLIVKPAFGLSTREGYERLGRAAGNPPLETEVPAFLDWEDVIAAVSNDFEAAWKDTHPEIGTIKGELLSAGAKAAGLSGSGSAVFGLFDSAEAAHRARGMLSREDGRKLFVARNI
ncbi:MAG: 4-diphosphocytidyl-2-C-methyl-D-erythritol kinase [Actinobacteria bacterium]|nr:4-diphosphocytidyl-2-C-methyl-D-erythritol kinase [Actinomycetota bacterium]